MTAQVTRHIGDRPANEDRTAWRHNSATLTMLASGGFVVPAGEADAVTVHSPPGGAHALLSAAVALNKLTAPATGDCRVWAWPVLQPSGQGLVGVFGGGSNGAIDGLLMLGSTGVGLGSDRPVAGGGTLVSNGYDTPLGAGQGSSWSEVGVSGSGNFGDLIDSGQIMQCGGTTIWLPEGERTIQLLYWANNCNMALHNRFIAVTLL